MRGLCLAWMIEGCILWQAEGLKPPQSVVDATDEYLQSEDTIATWIAERCELRESFQDTSAELFMSWKAWAELMGEPAISREAFSKKLGARPGIRSLKIGHLKARGYGGIRVVKIKPAQSNWMRDD
jgi:putative DNA primase/helicase